jgi:hypothetical protein
VDNVADERVRTWEVSFADQCRDKFEAGADVRVEVLDRFDTSRNVRIINRAHIAAVLAAAILRGVEIPVTAAVALLGDEAAFDREFRGEGRIQGALRQLGIENR